MNAFDERALWITYNVLPYEGALRAWLQRRCVQGLEVDDVIQETYARLSLLDSVKDIHNPYGYMLQTAQSVILMTIRRAKVVPMISMSQFDSQDFLDGSPDPEMVCGDRDLLARLKKAIDQLPKRLREVFVLRRVEGLSQRETAVRLGLSESTIEKHMAKSLRRVADALADGGNTRLRASGSAERRAADWHVTRDE